MKYLITLLSLVLAQQSFAAELICNPLEKKTVLATKVGPQETVTIYARETASNGYQWVSKEKLESKIVQPIDPRAGAWHLVAYTIKGDSKVQKSTKKYTFNYVRSWEREPPGSVCLVTIVRE